MTQQVARLAPSPTGAQHLGNARTYLLAWLSARAGNARVVLRIEDLDSPRVKPWAMQQAIDDLAWLGLDWDAGPYVQSERLERYTAFFEHLLQRERIYPCTCSRADIEAAASAPHLGQEGPRYPGTCSANRAADVARLGERPYAWRFRTEHVFDSHFDDLVAGPQTCQLARDLGDFVVAKPGGIPAYQLAVVVDDYELGVTEVVRGDDLLPSTHRQLALYREFGWSVPEFAHVPLVIGPDGRRLAKRHGDTRISLLRDRGIPAERLVGFLAWTCGLTSTTDAIHPRDLLSRFEWSSIPKEPFVLTDAHWVGLLNG